MQAVRFNYDDLLALAQRLPDLKREQQRRVCVRSLHDFVVQAWPILEPSTPFVDGRVVHAVCQHLEAVSDGRIKNLIINIPPGHMKSLLVSVFWPAWIWLQRPGTRFIGASHSAELSTRDNVKCRRLVESDWYQRLFSPDWQMTSDNNLKTVFENTATGFRRSTSVGAASTGHRGNVLIMDDLIAAMDVHSKSALAYHVAWYGQEFANRLNDLERDSRVLIMQRLHENDITGELLRDERDQWDALILPTEYEPERHCRTSIGFEDWRTEPGELLFPERFPAHVIAAEKRRLGPSGYAAQHQQRPAPAQGMIFKRDAFRRYDTMPERLDEVIQSWDMAFKNTDGSDFVCGLVLGRRGSRIYLLPDREYGRMGFSETKRAIQRLTARWQDAYTKLVEDKANGPAIMDDLAGTMPGLTPVEPDGGKEARAHAVTPAIDAGDVLIPSDALCGWIGEFLDEAASFPKAANDDQVDAFTQGVRHLMTRITTTTFTFDEVPRHGRDDLSDDTLELY